ncbi:MAG: DUF6933 domain-containing protein [Steroidobacteraceae bacterium]
MLSLRCTQIIRKRLGLASGLPEPALPGTLLGAWYLHLIRLGPQQVVMATSERSLLTVLLPAEEIRRTVATNLRVAVRDLLVALEIPLDAVQREVALMDPTIFGNAVNRRVIGSMNDFAYQLDAYVGDTSDPLELALKLCETPMSAIGSESSYGIPKDIARELLSGPYTGPILHH